MEIGIKMRIVLGGKSQWLLQYGLQKEREEGVKDDAISSLDDWMRTML